MFQNLSWFEENVIRMFWSIVSLNTFRDTWKYIDDFKWTSNVIIFQLLNVYILSNFFTELYTYTRKFDEVMMIEVRKKESRENTLNFTNWMRRESIDEKFTITRNQMKWRFRCEEGQSRESRQPSRPFLDFKTLATPWRFPPPPTLPRALIKTISET